MPFLMIFKNTGRPMMNTHMLISFGMVRVVGRTPDQHDAYVAAAWLRQIDIDVSLSKFLMPDMRPLEYEYAKIEGWILGVM